MLGNKVPVSGAPRIPGAARTSWSSQENSETLMSEGRWSLTTVGSWGSDLVNLRSAHSIIRPPSVEPQGEKNLLLHHSPPFP